MRVPQSGPLHGFSQTHCAVACIGLAAVVLTAAAGANRDVPCPATGFGGATSGVMIVTLHRPWPLQSERVPLANALLPGHVGRVHDRPLHPS